MIITEESINADFRSAEVTALRDEADIICTNPPFSLFRDFLAWINPDEKKFLILGNIGAVGYKEVFPLIRDNKMWLGVRKMGIDTYFKITEDYKKKLIADKRTSAYKVINGEVMARVGCIWFTNMDHRGRHEDLPLLPKDVLEASGVVYQKYDNYDAIEVPELRFIPSDYDGVMGVPISFLGRYNSEQFEILGMAENEDLYGLKTKKYTADECKAAYFNLFNKQGTYDLNRAAVLNKDGKLIQTYSRILIKK